MDLPGYHIHAQVYRSDRSIVEQATRLLDSEPVILKRTSRQYPLATDLAPYHQEYAIANRIQSDRVVRVQGLETHQTYLVLVLEDIGGRSLRRLYGAQPMALNEFLPVAIAITQGLGHIHAAQVIHKDLNPGNIIYNPETQQLRIIDFGLSSATQQETTALQYPTTIEGTLAYLSPEQTGRVNRLIDYRTDIYSLGVTFYELLAGALPFTTTDPMALVHSHIAKPPPSLADARPDLPTFLVDVVNKMMAKNAEDRYQSAWGIQFDLEQLLAWHRRPSKPLTLAIAQQDYPFQFRLPQTLYGREVERDRLLSTFHSVCQQRPVSPLMLVTGYSGIGKSALVQELYGPITEVRGYFAAGKFDQLQRAVPYSAIIAAFSDLLRQILSETTDQLAEWRSRILAAVGQQGQVILDVIPDVALVIGAQPAVPTLGPVESQNRFNRVFQTFVRVFAQADHPLVLFLDDLQWADAASLRLLQLLLSDADLGSFLLIGAYRNNEVDANHPLTRTLNTLRQEGITPTTLTLAPLNQRHVGQLLADALYETPETVQALASLVHGKTGGNPFFVSEFLKTLQSEQLLRFDVAVRRWCWDVEQIQAQQMTDNVVVLMAAKLKRLPALVQQLLSLAACIGASFDMAILSGVAERSLDQVSQTLERAVQAGLIWATQQGGQSRYQFAHDRVQQAAYDLLAEEQRAALHLRIGLLLRQCADGQDRLFEVADHLNLGRSLLPREERLSVAQLNLTAGRRAKQATAYQAAEQYFSAGISYLDDWHPEELAFSLHREWAEVLYLLGQFDASQQAIAHIQRQSITALQQAEVCNVLIVQYTIQTNYPAALAAGQAALAALGVSLPIETPEAAFEEEYAILQKALGDRSLASLELLPTMTEPDKIFAVELLSNLGSAAYRYNRRIWQLVVVVSINLFLKYGNVPQSCYGYSNYGTLLGSVLGDYRLGYESALVSLRLSERYGDRTQTSRACFILSNFVQSWVRPVAEADAVNQMGVDAGLETGEFQYVGYTLSYRISNLFFQGKPLPEVMAALQDALQFCQRAKNQWAIDALMGYRLVMEDLMAPSEDQQAEVPIHDNSELRGNVSMDEQRPGDALDKVPKTVAEAAYQQDCIAHKSSSGLCRYFILKALSLYLEHRTSEALEMIERATPLLDFILGVVSVAEYYFVEGLILAELLFNRQEQSAETSQLSEWHQRFHRDRQMLHRWAETCPENFSQKAQLLDAEVARQGNHPWDALQSYDGAIAGAVAHRFLQDEAIANERAARFWLSCGKANLAESYLKQAHYAFQRWGAEQKVVQLQAEFPWLKQSEVLEHSQEPTTQTSDGALSAALDLSSLLKASQTISSQIVLEQLTHQLMEILVENAGAQLGYLLLLDGEELAVAAFNGPADHAVAACATDPTHLPVSLINYVVRAQTSVVLADASEQHDFSHDPYLQSQQPKSVLCAPLLHQGKLSGVVYFENNLTTGAFTRDRLNVINLLSSQAAISIQNAQFYNTLEQKVAQRTQALEEEKTKSERLLLNILPASIAERLKQNEKAIADGFAEVTVMFCDIANFTPLASRISPVELVEFLNQIFSVFDDLCDRHQLEKIKTVGDAYIAVGGLPGSRPNHAASVADMALDMAASVRSFIYPVPDLQSSLQVRIGIHTGPVVAGVIGTKKFAYDLWGDTVNLASRMESQGEVGRIQVTEAVYAHLADQYALEERGTIQVKGRGAMTTYWLVARK